MADELVTTTAVEVDDLENKIMSFYIDDVIYGIDLKNVIEIISIQYITKVPNVPHYIKGVINLRGKIVPVIETRFKLDLCEVPYTDKTCIIVITLDDINIGLIVDSVNEVMTLTNDSVIPTKKEQKNKKYLKSVTKVDNQMVLNLDLNYLINDDYVSDSE